MPLREEMITQGNFLFRYRSFLPLIIVLLGMAVYVLHIRALTIEEQQGLHTWEFIALGVSILGLLVRVLCIGHAYSNTSGRNTSEGQIADEVNRTGIYATVRHPLYLGNFLMWLGLAMMTANTWFIIAFILMFWVYYERIMIAEEEFLRGKFGKIYEDWASQTPAFIPAIGQWVKPILPFSWLKVIRQEKAGILNLFIVFFLMKQLPRHFVSGYEPNIFWTYALMAALAWYIIIKVLQMTTSIFKTDR